VKAFNRIVYLYDPARKEIREWPLEVKKNLGSTLTQLQMGESVGMPDVRPMPAVARGVSEIRIKDQSGIYRAFL
jgi:phage-related protein